MHFLLAVERDDKKTPEQAVKNDHEFESPEKQVSAPAPRMAIGSTRSRDVAARASANGASSSLGAGPSAKGLETLEQGDTEFAMNEEDEDDDEATLDEAEEGEDKDEVQKEVDALQAEQDMPMEELLKKLGYAQCEDGDEEDDDDDDDEDDEVSRREAQDTDGMPQKGCGIFHA